MYTTSTTHTSTMEGYHKISISGVIFYVESDCKNLLLNHLKLLKKSYTNFNDSQFDSLEEKVADILLSELKGGKDIVTCNELEVLIQRTQSI